MAPLEEMACGPPVVATDLPSIREAYGDALLRCRVKDTAHLAERMKEPAREPALGQRLLKRGLARAARDRWDYKGAEMVRIFEGAGAGTQ